MVHRSKHHRKSNGTRKNFAKKSFDNSIHIMKSTSRKYMPKVKSGLENVGDKVVKTGQQSIPFLQRMTRKIFSIFGLKPKKSRRYR